MKPLLTVASWFVRAEERHQALTDTSLSCHKRDGTARKESYHECLFVTCIYIEALAIRDLRCERQVASQSLDARLLSDTKDSIPVQRASTSAVRSRAA